MNIEDLTQRQRDVVTAEDNISLVFGGPGTGKTTTALWAARKMLDRSDVPGWKRVLFLTFSRTAVGQIARRAPSVFGENPESIEISTFHSLAWRLINAFGRYIGQGKQMPQLATPARTKLMGSAETNLTYDLLIPKALQLLKSRKIHDLIQRRWSLIICDEFQDTSDEQWQFLTALSKNTRLLLLADANQMIYTFLKEKGVSYRRLEEAKGFANCVVELDSSSHRDPSGVVVAMAEEVRKRNFSAPAISRAVQNRRLQVTTNVTENLLAGVIAKQINYLRSIGMTQIGIFGSSNEGVSTLSAALSENSLDHSLIGITDAHVEALIALTTLCAWGVGIATEADVRRDLATFITSCSRGKIPDLALTLARGMSAGSEVEQGLIDLRERLEDAASQTLGNLVKTACQGWAAIGVTRGERPWKRACSDFKVLARRLVSHPSSPESVRMLMSVVERRKPNALLEVDVTNTDPVQLMNFHQTKGREMDAVVLVYRSGDYFGPQTDDEPFEEQSRVLFVSLTRARQHVSVILPPEPHRLVASFARWGSEQT